MTEITQRETQDGGGPFPADADAGSAESPVLGAHTGEMERSSDAATRLGILIEGSRFGGYLVGGRIGSGGMACIYRAEHEGLRRQVALKVLTNGFATDPERRERFLREARIAAAIKHPNVVNIFDVGVFQEIPYLVMELLEGEDLEAMVQRKGALDENTMIDIMVPVVAGLAAVHDAGIVHRDLKPGNIFLAKNHYDELEAKLLDFGISKSSGADELKLTRNGLLIGTPFYMAPEGLRGSEMSPRSDQYSLGVVMYECLTGINPFIANTFGEVYERITRGTYLPAQQVNNRVSPRLGRIIERAMHLDPEQRYGDVRELGRDLLMLAGQRTRITWGLTFGDLARSNTHADGDQLSSADKQAIVNFKSKRAVWAVSSGAALLLGGGVLLGGALHRGSPEQQGQAATVGEEQLSLQPYQEQEEAPTSASSASTRLERQVVPAGSLTPATPSAPAPASTAVRSDPVQSLTGATAGPSRVTAWDAKSAARAEAARRPKEFAAREQQPNAAPDWAVPGSVPTGDSPSERDKLRLGANNAPILD